MQLPFDLGVPLQYVYLVMMVPLALIWLFFYWKYPRYRKAFLISGLASGTVGHLSVLLMFRFDWWIPISFMGNQLTTLEDIVLAGANAGLVIIVWPILTGQHFKETLPLNKLTAYRLALWWLTLLLTVYALYILGTHSFVASVVVYTIFVLTVLIRNPSLTVKALTSAIVVTAATIPFYIGIQLLNNSYVTSHYVLTQLSGETFLNVPIEDYIWYFAVNFMLGVFYHYIFESKFTPQKISLQNSLKSIGQVFNLKQVDRG